MLRSIAIQIKGVSSTCNPVRGREARLGSREPGRDHQRPTMQPGAGAGPARTKPQTTLGYAQGSPAKSTPQLIHPAASPPPHRSRLRLLCLAAEIEPEHGLQTKEPPENRVGLDEGGNAIKLAVGHEGHQGAQQSDGQRPPLPPRERWVERRAIRNSSRSSATKATSPGNPASTTWDKKMLWGWGISTSGRTRKRG